jgi:hypothetical protein
VIEAVAEIGDQLEAFAGLAEHSGVDAVRYGGHQHIGGLHHFGQVGLAHGLVVEVEVRVEQLAHASLDGVRQFAGDDHQGLFGFRHSATWAL